MAKQKAVTRPGQTFLTRLLVEKTGQIDATIPEQNHGLKDIVFQRPCLDVRLDRRWFFRRQGTNATSKHQYDERVFHNE
jgi:hypothetical protein